MASSTRLRRAIASVLAALLLGSVGLACSDDDDTGSPVERDTSENPNGGGTPTEDDDAGTGGTGGETGDTVVPGQPNSGENDAGENDATQDVEG